MTLWLSTGGARLRHITQVELRVKTNRTSITKGCRSGNPENQSFTLVANGTTGTGLMAGGEGERYGMASRVSCQKVGYTGIIGSDRF